MGDIVTTITVDVEGAGSLDALADAAERAAAAVDKLDASLGKGLDASAGAAGMDKMAADMSAALSKIQAQVDALDKAMADIGKAGAGGDAGAASLAKIGDAAKGAAAEADAMAASVGRADDTLKGLGGTADTSAAGLSRLSDAGKAAAETTAALKDTSAGAADGLKGIGAGADLSAAQMAEFNKVMADSAAMQAQTAKVSADASLAMARSSQVQADAKTSLGTTSVEQDAAMAQSAKLNKAAQEDAAASAEAQAGKHGMLALAMGAAAVYGIDKASQLQASVTRLYTSAGESKKNLPMIEQGILQMAPQTATSQASLAQGAYWVESGGYHGQNALAVLKAAAEGSYAEGAELPTVANALTTVLTDYYGGPQKSAKAQQQQSMQAMNAIMTEVGRGKMTLQGAASAMPMLLPAAKTAGLSLPQIFGAEATMTAGGMSAEQSAMDLRHTITSLQKPSNVQAAEMQMLGINPNQLSHDLGREGLTGTIAEVGAAIQKHIGAGGMVLLDTMNQSKLAVQSANEEIAAMPPAIQGMAKAYMAGTVSAKQFNQEIFSGPESARDKALLSQFQTTASNALGFSALVKSGLGDKQTQAAALNELLGGQTGMQVAQMIGGSQAGTFKSNVAGVAQSEQGAGDNIRGWSQVQATLKFQLGSAEQALQSVATEVGKTLLPAATTGLKGLADVGKFFAGNTGLTKDLAEIGGGLGALLGVKYVGGKAVSAADSIGKMFGFEGIGKSSGLDTAAVRLSAAAGRLEGAATSLKGENLPGMPGGKPGVPGSVPSETETAATDAEKVAPAGLTVTTLLPALQKAALPAAVMTWLDTEAKDYGQKVGQKVHAPQAKPGSTGDSVAYQVGQNVAEQLPVIGPVINAIEGLFGVKPGKPMATPYSTVPSEPSGGLPSAPRNVGVAEPGYGRFGPAGLPYGSPGTVKPKIMPPDLSGFTAQLAQAMHLQPVHMPPPDLSAMNAAKPQISAALLALSAVHPAPIKIPAPDLSALNAAKGQAQAAGSAAGAGFAAGVASETGAAAAAGAALAAAAESAMKVHLQISSPSKVTEKIGEDFGNGLAKGVTEASSAVKSAAAGLAQNAAGTIKAATASIGSDSVASLLQGLQGGQSNQQNATAALYGALANPDAVTTIQQTIQQLTQDIPAGKDTGLVKWLGQQQTKLDSLANRQGALMAQISDAQQAATQQISASSITGAGAYTPAIAQSGGPQSAQSTITGMGYMSADTQQFAAQLAQLQKMGLNATSLSQLAQGGATAGLPITEGLVSGGKGAIAQINALETKIIGASKSIGTTAGPAMYQSGLQVTDQLAQGLKDELAQVDKEMTAEANAVIKAVQKVQATASSSSSSSGSTAASSTAGTAGTAATAASTAGLGKIGPAASGAASGLSGVASAAASAAAGLSGLSAAASGAAGALGKITAALTPAAKPGSGHGGALQPMGGGGSAGGGTTTHVTHVTHVHVAGSVIAQQDLADHIQTVVLAKNSDNWQAGLVLPGRAL